MQLQKQTQEELNKLISFNNLQNISIKPKKREYISQDR